jgi:DNA recombination protein RmuC
MNDAILILGSYPVTWGRLAIGMAGVSFALLILVALLLLRSRRERALEAAIAEERAREMDDKVSSIISSYLIQPHSFAF